MTAGNEPSRAEPPEPHVLYVEITESAPDGAAIHIVLDSAPMAADFLWSSREVPLIGSILSVHLGLNKSGFVRLTTRSISLATAAPPSSPGRPPPMPRDPVEAGRLAYPELDLIPITIGTPDPDGPFERAALPRTTAQTLLTRYAPDYSADGGLIRLGAPPPGPPHTAAPIHWAQAPAAEPHRPTRLRPGSVQARRESTTALLSDPLQAALWFLGHDRPGFRVTLALAQDGWLTPASAPELLDLAEIAALTDTDAATNLALAQDGWLAAWLPLPHPSGTHSGGDLMRGQLLVTASQYAATFHRPLDEAAPALAEIPHHDRATMINESRDLSEALQHVGQTHLYRQGRPRPRTLDDLTQSWKAIAFAEWAAPALRDSASWYLDQIAACDPRAQTLLAVLAPDISDVEEEQRQTASSYTRGEHGELEVPAPGPVRRRQLAAAHETTRTFTAYLACGSTQAAAELYERATGTAMPVTPVIPDYLARPRPNAPAERLRQHPAALRALQHELLLARAAATAGRAEIDNGDPTDRALIAAATARHLARARQLHEIYTALDDLNNPQVRPQPSDRERIQASLEHTFGSVHDARAWLQERIHHTATTPALTPPSADVLEALHSELAETTPGTAHHTYLQRTVEDLLYHPRRHAHRQLENEALRRSLATLDLLNLPDGAPRSPALYDPADIVEAISSQRLTEIRTALSHRRIRMAGPPEPAASPAGEQVEAGPPASPAIGPKNPADMPGPIGSWRTGLSRLADLAQQIAERSRSMSLAAKRDPKQRHRPGQTPLGPPPSHGPQGPEPGPPPQGPSGPGPTPR